MIDPGIASLGVGLLAGGQNLVTNSQNYQAQVDAMNLNKELQFEAWRRGDMAVQRRASDLEAAGLSKTLAAGSAAQTMAPMKLEAPLRKGGEVQAGLDAYLATARMQADIAKTQAETKNVELQTNSQELKNAFDTTANPQRLMVLANQVKTSDIGVVQARLDADLSARKITRADVDLARAKIESSIAGWNLDSAQTDALAKKVALDTAKYNSAWYKRVGLPIGATLDPLSRYGGVAANVLEQVGGKLKDWSAGDPSKSQEVRKAMEAGKPSNDTWMGFDEETKQKLKNRWNKKGQ